MYRVTETQLEPQGSKSIVVQCDVPQLGLKYPHEVVFCNNKRKVEKQIKREPTSLSDFDEESASNAAEQQNRDNCPFVDGKVPRLVGMEHDNVNVAKAGFASKREIITSCIGYPSDKQRQSLSVTVKEECLSDEEVVDVYPAGIEIARIGNEAQSIGMHSNYNVVNCMEPNGIIDKRQGTFDGGDSGLESFERVSDGVFMGELGAESVENRFMTMGGSRKYSKPFLLTVGSDQVGGVCDSMDVGNMVHNDSAIGKECTVLVDTEESDYIYLVEASDHISKSGSLEGASVCSEVAAEDNLEQVVSNRMALGRVSGIENRDPPLEKVPTAETHDITQHLYYEVDVSDFEGGESDHSIYEPSSNESDSDGTTVSYDSKKHCNVSERCGSANAKRNQQRLPSEWKVERNRCKVCCCFFPTKQDLRTHTCIASKVSCKTCGKRLKDLDALQRHEKVHLELKPYSCEICGKGFREKGNLTTHKRTHTKEMPYQCQHCSKRFADPSNFNRHRKGHLGIAIAKPCHCKFCGERFSRTANLLRHLVRFHKGEQAVLDDALEIGTEAEVPSKFKMLACTYCGKKFGKKETLETHELLHNECKALTCKHCRRMLSSKDSLIRHLKIHGVEVDGQPRRNFICNYCGVSFKTKSSLTGHERTHKKEWLHTCKICKARFTLKTSLNRHLQIHSGNKPHGCDICSKRFLRAYDLTIHKRIHSNERPYVCRACGRSFAAQTNFSKHVKTCEAKANAD